METTTVCELDKITQAIINGDGETAVEVTQKALAAGEVPAHELVMKYMVPAMEEVGRRFEAGEYFFPELLISAKAMKAALDPLRPLLAASGAKPVGRAVMGTVKGDLHDIGKNLVSYLLEGSGFEVIDLGTDVAPERFVSAVRESDADIVGMSALLTTTMVSMATTIEALEKAGLRDRVKVMVGGAPVTQQFADQIGADGFRENAVGAAALARQLIQA